MTGTYGDNVNQDEDAVHFCTLTGSASITNDTISNGAESNLRIVNDSGTLNRLTMTNDTFGLNQVNGGDSGTCSRLTAGTSTRRSRTRPSRASRGSPFQAVPQAGASMDLVFGQPGHGNTVHNTHSNIVPFAQDLNVATGGDVDVRRQQQPLRLPASPLTQAQGGVFINAANSTANASGYFRNNTIGTRASPTPGRAATIPRSTSSPTAAAT